MMFSTLENLFNADYDFDVRTFFIGIPYPFDLKVPPFAMHTATLSFGSGSLRMGVVGLKWTKKILSAMTANCSEFKPKENKSKTKIKFQNKISLSLMHRVLELTMVLIFL